MKMNNNLERTVTTIIGTTSEEESHWGSPHCPRTQWMDVWKLTSDLPHWGNGTEHIETGDHKIRPDGKSLYDKAKQRYARRLQEPVLKQTHR